MPRPSFALIDLDDPRIPASLRPNLEQLLGELFRLERRVEALEDRGTAPRLLGPPRPATAEELARLVPQQVTIGGKTMTLLTIPEA